MHMNAVFIICSLLVGENRKRKLSVASQFSITIAETFINLCVFRPLNTFVACVMSPVETSK